MKISVSLPSSLSSAVVDTATTNSLARVMMVVVLLLGPQRRERTKCSQSPFSEEKELGGVWG